MKALCWYGKHDVRVMTVEDPQLQNPRDAIVKVTSSAICGSDLHLYDGHMPSMQAGDTALSVGATSTPHAVCKRFSAQSLTPLPSVSGPDKVWSRPAASWKVRFQTALSQ